MMDRISKVGGWSRLWLVLTVVWVALISFMFSGGAPKRASFDLSSTTTTETADALADAPKPDWSAAPIADPAVSGVPNPFDQFDADKATSEAAYQSAVRSRWIEWLQAASIPPVLVALAMLASGWIWRGFARR